MRMKRFCAVKKIDVLTRFYDRLQDISQDPVVYQNCRGLVYGFPKGYGGFENPVAVALINYGDDNDLKLAKTHLPYGCELIGLVEFETDQDQSVYAAVENVDNAVLLKASGDGVVASAGLDYLSPVAINVVPEAIFWEKCVCTFRLHGSILSAMKLEFPDLQDCYALSKLIVKKQAAFAFGKKPFFLIVPPDGLIASAPHALRSMKVIEICKILKKEAEEANQKTTTYFRPGINLVDVKVLFDHTIPTSSFCAPVARIDNSARCKFFDHYLDLDTLVVVPLSLPVTGLYKLFIDAIINRLELGLHENINQQLINSISAEKPQVFHLWPTFCDHFISVFYPSNMSEEKLTDNRLVLHKLFSVKEKRPYFRRSTSLFQSLTGLVSPHVTLTGKFRETEIIRGHYEYRHYMQEEFNDDGWGCAYRSLQTIVSWFRLQGFTEAKVPTHREIQECLVSLGDKPASFVGSKQWIGSTEVSFVLEALLGVSCRIMSLSSGGEMASRASELQSHFRIHGTPVMIGGGVLAHTLIGASCDPDNETNVSYLVLDPHYTGKDDLKTILGKGWVGWKDNNFWSKKDFYNLCMPLLPSGI